ncbi:double-strand break repair helicase AddA [Paraurantiacibacter namhicola]|uniref:DNA 3'-5' helicase n=1 Tax=Paraurantiacibacter namhicola TaxID=645517 RepID=A0A1C7D9R9_9SPHN|nr:double-strand break repair helicase AddA [Paraurantiacibacter namhicola]ANU08177.1 ATP-dependent helicase/nuclease subunit A [Paraurantiacibacter namhicola]
MSGEVYPLAGEQQKAVDPQDSIWLSASAGTGKTQVLSARVLRLLLQPGIGPSQILCLTFTKAGAAEMATRINEVLARWVRLPDDRLGIELGNIGAPITPDTRARARTLFAKVLDCPGGGLRIDTIHAFSQWLLSAFPEEVGLTPGTRAMEDRDRDLLARDVLADMLVEAERAQDTATLETIALLSRRLGPDAVQGFLMRCADARAAWIGHGAWRPPMAGRVKQLLGMPADADEAWVAEACSDEAFPVDAMRGLLPALEGWQTKAADTIRDFTTRWLEMTPAERAEALDGFSQRNCILKKDGDPTINKGAEKNDPSFGDKQQNIADAVREVRGRRALLELAGWLAPALELGRIFALAWDEAKQREGYIDFDDQIRKAARLLGDGNLGPWIRYKLDRQFDHVLIDEAQDTNAAQWSIVEALTGEFFSGLGQRGERLRTIFVVGDYKQAIFRFQGTSPENFEAARLRFRREMDEAAANAEALRDPNIQPRKLEEFGLDQSFRTAQDILDFVDKAVAAVGWQAIGLREPPGKHSAFNSGLPGQVVIWPPVGGEEDREASGEEGAEGWLSRPERVLADRIARQVRAWMDTGFPLLKGQDGKPRRAGPGDIMVLVRKRRDLAGLIVARLYARGVPVAGVDRLRLGAPLAVKDLMSALRFAAQPLDDLELANLLVSPLVGWSQDDLLEHAYRPDKRSLWRHLRRGDAAPKVRETVEKLNELLARADFETPLALLHWMLTEGWQGRRKLVTRLGTEANDPIDELLGAAQKYAATHTASLTGFIHWFDAGDGELKREAGAGEGLVQVMTVHGSKGLEKPIVILADAAGRPGGMGPEVTLEEAEARGLEQLMEKHEIPIPRLPSADRAGPVAEAHDAATAAELEEHWRLLYVAMTRAEEALFIAGSLGSRDKAPHEDSWYARLDPLFNGDWQDDPIWHGRKMLGSARSDMPGASGAAKGRDDTKASALPDWAVRPVGAEPRPPRPLAPSSAGADDSPAPPFPPGGDADAARRGVLIHALLERLPDVPADEREARALDWLARHAGDMDEGYRAEMVANALGVLAQDGWAAIFGPGALAEVPLAATVDGQVIAGTADRLLVEEDRVLVVDFKTARRPPESLDQVPSGTLAQMGAYAAALGVIFPGKRVEAAVLYTQTPQLIAIPGEMLAANKPRLREGVESFRA